MIMTAPTLTDFIDPAVRDSVTGFLATVETELRVAVASPDPLVDEVAAYLVQAGGKRFRPLTVALCAQLGDPDRPELLPSAVLMELTHLATLYHDDVMDEASLRRGAASANSRWSNKLAVYVGDFLLARAAQMAAGLGEEAVRLQARTLSQLVRGQLAETVGPRGADPIRFHLQAVEDKTASLIATSARFGGLFSGLPAPHVETLAEFGTAIGIAFQLSDDLLDIASESEQSGKTPGTDLREGVPTLPMLYALAADDTGADVRRLKELLSSGPIVDDALHAEALGLLRGSAALKQARETVHGYAGAARRSAGTLPDGAARRTLESLCHYIADRTG
ncbi:heptaprenyl diphosphate synthase [Actinoplanes derwentensis]|uniref:Heptaprenyl diphosphate synthase n=2 Tax=Actinoplanes derwentensis TaxID=113562 RepID=A0A1H2D885_9ACTN|nr:polyprenyl synthetase family protein [Actinoplanes derwentensis]GID89455.1 geranylgeranyl pyrophosphate synthase [Actinoplanes derwentensis]SDT78476.1 heptaprenyl diphosphate synthase [Actinoplanes derwentensis]